VKKEPHFVSLYDLSFTLIFVFLFMSVIFISSLKEAKEKEKKSILQIIIAEKELFNEGEYVFKDESIAFYVIKTSIDSLYDLWKSDTLLKNKKIKNITVTGHTDNLDIGMKLKIKYHNLNYSNWNLSLDRANQVINLIIENKMLEGKEGLEYGMLLPSGKSFYMPATENIKKYLIDASKINNIKVKDIDSLSSDEIWKYIEAKFTDKMKEDLIYYCNRTPELREKNRRIEIRLELWD